MMSMQIFKIFQRQSVQIKTSSQINVFPISELPDELIKMVLSRVELYTPPYATKGNFLTVARRVCKKWNKFILELMTPLVNRGTIKLIDCPIKIPSDSQVTQLDLRRMDMDSEILESALARYVNIQSLLLDRCSPDINQLAKLTGLQFLQLQNCTLPNIQSLARCTSLKVMSITECPESIEWPDLTKCTFLKKVSISARSGSIGALPLSLTKISLVNTSFREKNPLALFTRLKKLWFIPSVKADEALNISYLNKLKSLGIKCAYIPKNYFMSVPRIETLKLSSCGKIAPLNFLAKLKRLFLEKVNCPENLSSLQGLTELGMHQCEYSSICLRNLNIKTLKIVQSHNTFNSLVFMGANEVENLEICSDPHLARINASALSKLTKLIIWECPALNEIKIPIGIYGTPAAEISNKVYKRTQENSLGSPFEILTTFPIRTAFIRDVFKKAHK